MAKAASRLELDHCLEASVRKPGALPGATAREQARAAGKFTPVHDAWWAAADNAHGDAAGTVLVEVLLHRHMSHDHVVAGGNRQGRLARCLPTSGAAGRPPGSLRAHAARHWCERCPKRRNSDCEHRSVECERYRQMV
jgi:hypothetical protein